MPFNRGTKLWCLEAPRAGLFTASVINVFLTISYFTYLNLVFCRGFGDIYLALSREELEMGKLHLFIPISLNGF